MKILIFIILTSILPAKDLVTTSIIPNKFIIEKIARDFIFVNVMVPAGASVHSYEPKAQQMLNLSKSKIYFANGVEFEEAWLPKFQSANKKLVIAHMDENVKKISTQHKGKEVFDAHIWTDPENVKIQAQNVEKILSQFYPEKAGFFKENLANFEKEIDELDEEIREKLKDKKNRKFLIQHPSWTYFAARYNLEQLPLEFEGKEIKPALLAQLINLAKKENIKMLIVSPNFSQKNAEILARELSLKLVTLNELEENWLENMKEAGQAFQDNLD